MNANDNVIAAFSEEHAQRLTGVSKSQLRYWDKTGFYSPSYREQGRIAFSRVYSFKDIVALRVLNVLRNQFKVPLQHLRDVSRRLGGLCDDPRQWINTQLYPLNGKVFWYEPGTDQPQEVASGQYLSSVKLDDVVQAVKHSIEGLRTQRSQAQIGVIQQSRFIAHNVPVLAGTRIPVNAIKRFAAAGYSPSQILAEYPDITEQDIVSALAYQEPNSAA